MKIQVSVGTKEPIVFNNSKVSIQGSQGVVHQGNLLGGQVAQDTEKMRQENIPVVQPVSVNPLAVDTAIFTELKMGQKVSVFPLLKEDRRFLFGLNWEAKREGFDIDVSVFLVDAAGKSREDWFVFYGNKVGPQGCVILDEDLGLGLAPHFQKQLVINLDEVIADVHRIAVVATVYEENETFSRIKNGSIKMVDTSQHVVLDFPFTDRLTDENAIVICELYRHQDQWKIQGIGQGFKGGLPALCKNYEVEVE